MRLSTLALALCIGLTYSGTASAQQTATDGKTVQSKATTSAKAHLPQTAFAAKGGVFSEGFNGQLVDTPPAGWVVENANADEFEWKIITSAANATRIRTGDGAAAVFWNSAAAADDWMISPEFTLDAGVAYRVSAWFLPGDGAFGTAESIELTIGNGQTVAAQTTVLADLNNVGATGVYQEITATFTPSAAGSFNLGFHCNSPADQYYCAIDDVSVAVAPTGPVLTLGAASVDFGMVATGGSLSETISVTNTGVTDLTISSITPSGDGFTVDMTGTSMTLAAGASTSFDVTFSPATEGAATGSISVASDDPGSPATIALSGVGVGIPDNDNIADATPISMDGTYTGTNVLATLEDGEPVPSCQENQGASVFWAYTPGSDGTVDIDLSASDFDTLLSFHQADGTEIACDDDGSTGSNTLASLLVDQPVTSGTTYLIRVAGFFSSFTGQSEGNISFNIALSPTVANEVAPEDGVFTLSAPQPNPASSATRVALTVEAAQAASIIVYDLVGRAVATLHEGSIASGETEFSLDTSSLQAGQYVIRALGETFVSTQRLTVVR